MKTEAKPQEEASNHRKNAISVHLLLSIRKREPWEVMLRGVYPQSVCATSITQFKMKETERKVMFTLQIWLRIMTRAKTYHPLRHHKLPRSLEEGPSQMQLTICTCKHMQLTMINQTFLISWMGTLAWNNLSTQSLSKNTRINSIEISFWAAISSENHRKKTLSAFAATKSTEANH